MQILAMIVFPMLAAWVYIAACSLLREPGRREFSAIMLAGAGAAYLNGGLGGWEFGFCGLITFVAYRGLKDYRWIAVGWLLHSGWDVVQHLYGNPIVPFVASSSAGCAVCDVALAFWCWRGAPGVLGGRGRALGVEGSGSV